VPASAKHSQTMSKNWYAETCIPYGLHTYRRTFFMHRPSPRPCLSGYGLALPAPPKRFAETSVRTGAGLGDATHVSSRSYRVAATIRPRAFLSKTMAPAIPCGRVGGGLGMVLAPAKHAGFPGRKGRPRSSGSERKSPKQKAPGSATARLSLYLTPGHVWNARLVRHRGNTLKSSRSTTGDFCHTVCSQTTLLSNRHITLRFLSDYLSLAGGQGSVV
jgi:hypothetical protein